MTRPNGTSLLAAVAMRRQPSDPKNDRRPASGLLAIASGRPYRSPEEASMLFRFPGPDRQTSGPGLRLSVRFPAEWKRFCHHDTRKFS